MFEVEKYSLYSPELTEHIDKLSTAATDCIRLSDFSIREEPSSGRLRSMCRAAKSDSAIVLERCGAHRDTASNAEES